MAIGREQRIVRIVGDPCDATSDFRELALIRHIERANLPDTQWVRPTAHVSDEGGPTAPKGDGKGPKNGGF